MKRVIVTSEQLRYRAPGGIGTYIRGLQSGLATNPASGVEVNWHDPRLPLRAVSYLWEHKLLAVNKADLVHATSLRIPPTSKPLVVTVHDLLWRQFPEAFPERGIEWHERQLMRALSRGSAFVVPSNASRDVLIEAGASPSAVHAIAHGTDHLPAPNVAGAEELLKGLNVSQPFLLTVGTREPRKNLVRIANAARQASTSLPEALTLLAVGPRGWNIEDHEFDNVVAVESISAEVLAGLYALAHLFLYVPLSEGYGLPAVEAMSLGIPVIASPVPSVDPNAARVVDPLSEDEIAKAIYELWTDSDARFELAHAGKLFTKDKTWANSARQHLELWESLL